MRNVIYLFMISVQFVFGQSKTDDYVNQEFKEYWYTGKAEITSYDLEQARYGEIRKGNVVHIFVTEPFSKTDNTKADREDKENVSVLKLNATKKFYTGVYPYSIMTSTFYPVKKANASLKISSSTQEWCGHEYTELSNKENSFSLSNFSYFQGASYRSTEIKKTVVLEDDIWSKIRLTPWLLPQGKFNALPSFVYLRFSHQPVKAYEAVGYVKKGNTTSVYQLKYTGLDRVLEIEFENRFPYTIVGWDETYESGWGAKRKRLTTKARLKKVKQLDYWNTNNNKDLYLRKELGL